MLICPKKFLKKEAASRQHAKQTPHILNRLSVSPVVYFPYSDPADRLHILQTQEV